MRSLPRAGWLEVEEFSSFPLNSTKINLAIDCAIKEGEDLVIYDWKTGRTLPENISLQLCCYALYAIEKWHIPLDHLRVIEFNLSFGKAAEFSLTPGEVEEVKSFIRGSVKDMRSLLSDPGNNIPMEEARFSKVEEERITSRCNFRKVCRP